MASLLEGMFTTPQDIRNKRMDELLAERQAIGRMGGSFDQLLGQVAAGGSATGAMLAEGTAGMFGLQTPEERKAAEIQKLMTSLQDVTDPQAYYAAARKLNDMGFTREALAVTGLGSEKLKEQQSTEMHTKSLENIEQSIIASKSNVRTSEAAEARNAAIAGRTKRIDALLTDIPVGDDPRKFFLAASAKLGANGFAAEAAEYAKLAASEKTERYKAIGSKIFDTKEGKFLTDGELTPAEFGDAAEYDYYIENLNLANQATTIAGQTDSILSLIDSSGVDMAAGKAADVEAALKNAFGERDVASEINVMIESVRTQEAFKNLPPGPATEKEVEGAFRTVPPDNASLTEKVKWVQRAQRANKIVAKFRDLENQWLENNRTIIGLSSARSELMEQAVKDVDAALGKKNELPTASELQGELDALRGGNR